MTDNLDAPDSAKVDRLRPADLLADGVVTVRFVGGQAELTARTVGPGGGADVVRLTVGAAPARGFALTGAEVVAGRLVNLLREAARDLPQVGDPGDLTMADRAAMAAVRGRHPKLVCQVAVDTGLSTADVKTALSRLAARGLVRCDGARYSPA
jgi:hypothetical protein